jgi:formiminotetrahydrofolate cyclodeaminase
MNRDSERILVACCGVSERNTKNKLLPCLEDFPHLGAGSFNFLCFGGQPMADSFLGDLAKPRPDPGGGAAAAHGALIGLALLEKVFYLEYARAKQTIQTSEAWDVKREDLRSLFDRIKSLREEDRLIYPRLIKEKGSQGNTNALLGIIEDSIAVPLRIMEGAIEGLVILSRVGAHCKKILKPDLLVAAELLGAALRGAFHIGWANLPLAKKVSLPSPYEQDLKNTLKEGIKVFNQVSAILSSHKS